jgi:hypothetical protein
MSGGDGEDFIDGDEADDALSGGAGDDTIQGDEGADAIEGGAPVGAVVLAACPVNGAPVVGTCWTMAPDQYEKALGMIVKLQVKMAADDRRV